MHSGAPSLVATLNPDFLLSTYNFFLLRFLRVLGVNSAGDGPGSDGGGVVVVPCSFCLDGGVLTFEPEAGEGSLTPSASGGVTGE